jgi:hypothetical protein
MSDKIYVVSPAANPEEGPSRAPPIIVNTAGKFTNCVGPKMEYLIILSETANAITMAVYVTFFTLGSPSAISNTIWIVYPSILKTFGSPLNRSIMAETLPIVPTKGRNL